MIYKGFSSLRRRAAEASRRYGRRGHPVRDCRQDVMSGNLCGRWRRKAGFDVSDDLLRFGGEGARNRDGQLEDLVVRTVPSITKRRLTRSSGGLPRLGSGRTRSSIGIDAIPDPVTNEHRHFARVFAMSGTLSRLSASNVSGANPGSSVRRAPRKGDCRTRIGHVMLLACPADVGHGTNSDVAGPSAASRARREPRETPLGAAWA